MRTTAVTPPPTSPITDAELAAIRSELPVIRDEVAYLNAGTLGPMPAVAIEAMRRVAEYDALERQGPDLWDRLGAAQQAARGAVASMCGVGLDQAALMHSTHEGVNTCAWGLDLRDGENVVTMDEEHPGLLVPLRHVRDRTGVAIRIAPWATSDEAFVDGVVAQVDASTRAVFLSHVSWVSGRIAPLRALRAALPDQVRIVVDGAQSAGVLPVDPSDGWDAYTVSGQKWPCGPNGSGGLALVDPEAWLPTAGAYMQVSDPERSLTSPVVADGRRFEQSQEAMVPLAGFTASVAWLTERVGIRRAHAHARACNATVRGLLTAGGIDEASIQGFDHLLCIDMPDAPDVSARLAAGGIMIRPLGAARIRLSFGCWTSSAELERACGALLAH